LGALRLLLARWSYTACALTRTQCPQAEVHSRTRTYRGEIQVSGVQHART
jgi:hypothetical protein